MGFWVFLIAFTNRSVLLFLYLPEVPFIVFNRKFMNLGNSSITSAYLGHILAFSGRILALSTFSEVRG